MNTEDIAIRPWTPDDDLSAITALLHETYGALAERGFKYLATWQDDATTLERLEAGTAFVAIRREEVLGTITLYGPGTNSCAWYARPEVCHFGQFGVRPSLQGQGLGNRLLEAVEDEAKACGYPNIALDTAEGADHLIAWYERKAYRFVEFADWEITNYRSVIMNKVLELDL